MKKNIKTRKRHHKARTWMVWKRSAYFCFTLLYYSIVHIFVMMWFCFYLFDYTCLYSCLAFWVIFFSFWVLSICTHQKILFQEFSYYFLVERCHQNTARSNSKTWVLFFLLKNNFYRFICSSDMAVPRFRRLFSHKPSNS